MQKAARLFLKKSLGIAFRGIASVQQRLDRGLTVFVFHEVSDNPSKFALQYDLSVTPDVFQKQAEWIRENFNVIHPSKLLARSKLPSRAAIISFDDGFLGTFVNGLPILRGMELPSIVFLNMAAVTDRHPILSAKSCYLEDRVPEYVEFCKTNGIVAPYYLSVTPNIMANFQVETAYVSHDEILDYQGAFASVEVLSCWDKTGTVAYGNHLFDHWNALALTEDELENQYRTNENALSQFGSYLKLFAFTNGQPKSCFLDRHVKQIADLGAARLFSAKGGVNTDHGALLLTRLGLSSRDVDADQLWFRVGRAALTASRAVS